MLCPKCNARINKTSVYCSKCGAKIAPHEDEEVKDDVLIDETVQEPEQRSSENEMIDTYIKTNVMSFKNTGFSFPAFFFGPVYYMYRKLYLEGLVIFLITLIGLFVLEASFVLTICISLYCGFTFKSHYMKHVKKQVDETLRNGASKSNADILVELYNKGGTTIAPIVVISVLYCIAIALIIFLAFILEFEENNKFYYDDYEEDIIETHLYYEVPENFLLDEEYNAENFISYKTEDSHCSFYITSASGNSFNDNGTNSNPIENLSLKTIEDAPSGQDEYGRELINGTYWYVEEEVTPVSKKHTLTTTQDNKDYKMAFFYITDEAHAYCEDAYNLVKNSLEIR